MSDAVIVALIGSVVAVINTVITMFVKGRVEKVNTEVKGVKEDLVKVKIEIDGRLTELVKVTAEAEKAKGHLEGRAQQASETVAVAETTKEIVKAIKEIVPAAGPTKVIIAEPADVKIVEDKTKEKGK